MGETGASQSEGWLTLSLSGLAPRRLLSLLEAFGSADAILGAGNTQLTAVDGITATHVGKLRAAQAEVAGGEMAGRLRDQGVELVAISDDRYPALLREIDDPPPVLFMQGELTRRDELAVALVGTRRRSPYGEMVAGQLTRELVRRGFTIISGLAMGIDADAHEAAVEAGGRTIGVLGCGIDVDYPRQTLELRRRITQTGAVISEAPPGAPPTSDRFPRRNRIISGLALGTVVVEAPAKSGALITARLAGEQGREVFAVPGNITSPLSRGCHELLRQGAVLVETAEDVVAGLGIMLEAVPEREPEPERRRKLDDLPGDQRAVLDALSHQPRNIDDVIADCGLATAQVSAALMLLEVKGLARRFPGNQFVRV